MKKNKTKNTQRRLNDIDFMISEVCKAVSTLGDNLANVSSVISPLVAANDLLISKEILDADEISSRLTELQEKIIADEGKA